MYFPGKALRWFRNNHKMRIIIERPVVTTGRFMYGQRLK